jgi:hypothetical protein
LGGRHSNLGPIVSLWVDAQPDGKLDIQSQNFFQNLNPVQEDTQTEIRCKSQDKGQQSLGGLSASQRVSAFPVVPYLGDQHPMPSQDRIWCKQSPDLFESLPPKNLAIDSQSPPLVITQHNAFPSELF